MPSEFDRRATIWKTATIHLSNLTEKYSDPAYREIIAMGPEVVPLIFEEL